MKELKFNPGDIIFSEGEDSRQAYWLSTGRVGITIGTQSGQKMLAQLGPGQLFGEMGLIDDLPRSATATALEPTEVEVIDEDTFESAVIGRPERLSGYLAALFERIRTADSQLQAEINKRTKQEAPSPEVAAPVSVRLESRYSGAASDQLQAISVSIDHFPYRIGRKISKGMTPFVLNDLEVEDPAPYNISRNHCSIEIDGGNVVVRDRGSAHGTIVNDHPLNVRDGDIIRQLIEGENDLLFGNERSPHRFVVIVERS
jgi:CRP-like cAMP-binding protein